MYFYRVAFEIRWDQLAHRAYGDANRLTELLQANKDIAVWSWLPVGLLVACPILLDAATSPADTLPPWKQ